MPPYRVPVPNANPPHGLVVLGSNLVHAGAFNQSGFRRGFPPRAKGASSRVHFTLSASCRLYFSGGRPIALLGPGVVVGWAVVHVWFGGRAGFRIVRKRGP